MSSFLSKCLDESGHLTHDYSYEIHTTRPYYKRILSGIISLQESRTLIMSSFLSKCLDESGHLTHDYSYEIYTTRPYYKRILSGIIVWDLGVSTTRTETQRFEYVVRMN
ncbi:hypothetical protein AVEN_189027-1 [Araneus ventricosus]|uniref:Uncharacterized protein n=1 Tax=Araneus ventricosus TaxID=182803 RepID=A0A4Y2MHF7_ARAVE|nr:hypothetical protein AVEN_189027-1 [Araneus ventricosus]